MLGSRISGLYPISLNMSSLNPVFLLIYLFMVVLKVDKFGLSSTCSFILVNNCIGNGAVARLLHIGNIRWYVIWILYIFVFCAWFYMWIRVWIGHGHGHIFILTSSFYHGCDIYNVYHLLLQWMNALYRIWSIFCMFEYLHDNDNQFS